MNKHTTRISKKWIRETLALSEKFLCGTGFPNPLRMGERGPDFAYPGWSVMFVAILAVKPKIKSYIGIRQMSVTYWDVIAEGLGSEPIGERQLRDRLKKISVFPGKAATFVFHIFSGTYRAESHRCG